jgi:hypothetical protein
MNKYTVSAYLPTGRAAGAHYVDVVQCDVECQNVDQAKRIADYIVDTKQYTFDEKRGVFIG